MSDYPIQPVPFNAVSIDDKFWRRRLDINRTVTIPTDFQKCEETGRIDNFSKASGEMEGEHQGRYFNDSDVFKVIEGAAYSLIDHPDPELDAYLDDLIAKIAASQEADGYLYTARTINERNGTTDLLRPDVEGETRWSHLCVNHELYNVGHLYEAAAAHYHATGKRSLLDVALRSADLICDTFGPDGLHDVPGHQEIEIGLAKLYRITGQEKYLQTARFFLDERGNLAERTSPTIFSRPAYMQDHEPVTEQREAVGHAVRAVYMYAGMADVAALTGDVGYISAMDNLWENVVSRKLYLTGGIGARHAGEAFGDDYELPNETAYNETCAAIANIFWNHRLFLLHGDAKYLDVLERTLYNGYISGVGFSGDTFFYPNPLASSGGGTFDDQSSAQRQPWFTTSCCPTNVVRFFPQLPGYVYAVDGDNLYVNLYIAGEAALQIGDNAVTVTQTSNYPWEGHIRLQVMPEEPKEFTLHLRIPGWSQGMPVASDLYSYVDSTAGTSGLTVNGEAVALEMDKGFAVIRRHWQTGDAIELVLDMPVRRVLCHTAVDENVGSVALERGPIVYCIEGVDNGGTVDDIYLSDDASLTVTWQPDLLQGINTIIWQRNRRTVTAIPYYAWAHRGENQMAVWISRR